MNLQDCDLSIRTKKLLLNADIKTDKDLCESGYDLLIKFRGFGKVSIKEIVQFMKNNNLEFNN